MTIILTPLLVGIFLVVYFLVWPRLSDRARRTGLLSLLLVSVLVNLMVFTYYLSESYPMGDGQIAASPNGLYTAMANSQRPVFASKTKYYLLTIQSNDGRVLKSVRVDTSQKAEPLNFRMLPNIIQWKPDSSEVTFDFGEFHITIKDL